MSLIPPTTDSAARPAQLAPRELSSLLASASAGAEADGAGSQIVLLRLTRDICRTLLAAADLRLGLQTSANAVAKSLHAAVSIRADDFEAAPVEATGTWNGPGTPGSVPDAGSVRDTEVCVPIQHGDELLGSLSIAGFPTRPPLWLKPHLLQPFLEGVAEELARCLSLVRVQREGRRRHELRLTEAGSVGVVTLEVSEVRGRRPEVREGSAKFDSDSDLRSPTSDLRFFVTTWGRGAQNLLGWRSDEAVGREFAALLGNRDCPRLHGMLSDAARGRRPAPASTSAVRWDRSEAALGVEAVPAAGTNGDEILLIIRDESREARLTRLTEMVHAAADVLTRSATTDVAGEPFVREICAAMRWARGELWLIDEAGTEWELQGVWTAPEVRCEALDALTVGAGFRIADFGLRISRIAHWQSTHDRLNPQSAIRNPQSAIPNPRAVAAAKSGLHDALGVPVVVSGELAAVLLFFNDAIPAPEDATTHALQAVATLLAGTLEREHLQRRLRESEVNALQSQKMEAMGRLAGGIVHDFNNLLTIIFGLSELIADTLDQNAPQRGMVAEIEAAGRRAAALTGQLLAFSRKQPLLQRIINVNARIDEIQSMLRRLVDERIELTVQGADAIHMVRFDPIQFEQVLLNLVVNARDAISGPGNIRISTRNESLSVAAARERDHARPGDFVVVSVTDSGCGMDEKTRARVLEPFFTTKEKGKGTGMGLSTVHGIVQQVDGFLSIASRPGEGTTVEIFLPRTNELPETMQADAMPTEKQRGDETILLVDDEDVLRSLTARMLEARGYTVLQASGGRQALELLKRNRKRIDLLVSDVMMPQMTGPELAARARALHSGLRVLFVSSYISPELADGDALAGVPVLKKPFTSGSLGCEVRRLLDEPSAK